MRSEEPIIPALRCASELYARLLEYAAGPPFDDRTAANVRRVTAMAEHRHGSGLCGHHQAGRAVAQAVEQIVFDRPPRGLRLIDRYADWSAELTDQDRRLLEAWRRTDVHAVFEITRRSGTGVRARCLADDLEYTLYIDPRTPMRREDLRTGRYVVGHALPVGESWMLVGAVDLYAPRERPAMLGLMAELVRCAPALPFRNPAITEQALAELAVQHQTFLELFGGQGQARAGSRLLDDLDRFWASSGIGDQWWPGLALEGDLCELREALGGLPDGGTWYPVHDPVHGLRVLGAPYGMLVDLHRSTAPIDAAAAHRVTAVLGAGHVPDFALRDLGERHPARAGEIYGSALGRPGFDWERDSAGWLQDRAGDGAVHPALVRLPERTIPAGSGKPDRTVVMPRPLVTSFPPVPDPSGVTDERS